MAQRINVVLNSIPSGSRDLVEFVFFCAVGFTAGSLGLLWIYPLTKTDNSIYLTFFELLQNTNTTVVSY